MANELSDKKVSYEVNGDTVELSPSIVSQFVTKGNSNLTNEEIVNFMQLARFQRLNPFLNEIYLIKFGSQPAQMVVSKEAFMKRAENNSHYRGLRAGILVDRNGEIKQLQGAVKLKDDTLIGAWADVDRDDRNYPAHVEVALDEFSKSQATWKQMPQNMIRKTAIVNALREAFPESLGSMYTEDDKDLNEVNGNSKSNLKKVTGTETDNSSVNDMLNKVKDEVKGDINNEPKSEGQSETVENSEQSVTEETTTETEQQQLL
ncbi:phage recombination protein Bet [Companilactobacillus sp. DQM5]|uniref:phage recombination protein Bet n=1 Tax=Companilactobacillus sp. DQM5 TaxID=3463359 RepID=UPI004059972E